MTRTKLFTGFPGESVNYLGLEKRVCKFGKRAQAAIALADAFGYLFLVIIGIVGYFLIFLHYTDVNSSIINSKVISVDNDLSLLNVMRSNSSEGILMSELLRQGLKDSDKYDIFENEIKKKVGFIVDNRGSYDLSIDSGGWFNKNINNINNPNDKCPTSFFGKKLVPEIESEIIIPYNDGGIIKLKLTKKKCE